MGHLGRRMSQSRTSCLVLPVSVDLATVHSAGKDYPWDRPAALPVLSGAYVCGVTAMWRATSTASPAVVDEALALPGVRGGAYDATPHALEAVPGAVVADPGEPRAEALAGSMAVDGGRQRQQYWNRGYLKQRQAAGGCGIWELYEAGLIVATHSLASAGTVCDPNPLNICGDGWSARGIASVAEVRHGGSRTPTEDRAVPLLAHQPVAEPDQPRPRGAGADGPAGHGEGVGDPGKRSQPHRPRDVAAVAETTSSPEHGWNRLSRGTAQGQGLNEMHEPGTRAALVNLRRELATTTLPVFLRIARQRGVVDATVKLSSPSLYRLFQRHGVERPAVIPQTAGASRRNCPTTCGSPTACTDRRSSRRARCASPSSSP